MTQYYPPENGKGEITFERWYVDDVTGMMYRRGRVVRDQYGRVVKDIEQDKTDHEDLSEGYPIRTESEVAPPE